jgi:hypothetical protein
MRIENLDLLREFELICKMVLVPYSGDGFFNEKTECRKSALRVNTKMRKCDYFFANFTTLGFAKKKFFCKNFHIKS